MIYIKNKNQFFKKANESFLNPGENRDVNLEFEDTLAGVLLNKLFGRTRDTLKKGAVSSLANQLDKLIARLFIDKTKEKDSSVKDKINLAEESYSNSSMTDYIQDTINLLSASEIKKDGLETLIEVSDDLLETTPIKSNKDYNEIVSNTKNTLMQLLDIIDNQSEKSTSTDLEVKSNQNLLPASTIKSKHTEIMSRLDKIDLYKEASEDIKEFIDNYYANNDDLIDKVDKLYEKNKNNSRVEKILVRSIYLIKQFANDNWKDVNISELLQGFEFIYKNINKSNEELSYIYESSSALNDLKKSLLESLSKAKSKIHSSEKLSKDDIKKIDNSIKENSTNILSGDVLKQITDIIQRANKKILRNDFSNIPKRQQKYYIPLGGTNIGKNKTAYDEWAKKVNNIVAYYNELLPDKVNKLLLNSLDDEYMINFNKLLVKYLSKDEASKIGGYTNIFGDTYDDDKRSKKVKIIDIVKVNKFNTLSSEGKVSILYQPFIVKTDKNYIIFLPIFSNGKTITCKYKANNIEWIKSYMGGDKLSNKGIYNMLLEDNKEVKYCTFAIKDVISIGSSYITARGSYTTLEKEDVKLLKMNINELYILQQSDRPNSIYKIKYEPRKIDIGFLTKYNDRIEKTDNLKKINSVHISKMKGA